MDTDYTPSVDGPLLVTQDLYQSILLCKENLPEPIALKVNDADDENDADILVDFILRVRLITLSFVVFDCFQLSQTRYLWINPLEKKFMKFMKCCHLFPKFFENLICVISVKAIIREISRPAFQHFSCHDYVINFGCLPAK